MIEIGIFLAYVLGGLLLWRRMVGAILHEFSGGYGIDGVDMAFGMMLGTIAACFWPPLVAGRLIYVVAKKYGDVDGMSGFFPPLKEVETKREREYRVMREREEAVRERQRAINAHERENGLTLTRWN